jgi:carbon storage regulator
VLVLTRKVGESIRIGDDIAVRVLDIQRGQVRFAIDAPREIPVHREEIYRVVQEQNLKAASAVGDLDPTDLWQRSKGKKS